MDNNIQDHKKVLTKPQVERLKALGSGLKVGKVIGDRVLVKTVKPWTDMDRVEKEGLLAIPQSAREANTPKESTGVVVGVGTEVSMYSELEVGTMVMFSVHSGWEFAIGGEDGFRVLDTKEILCTLEQTEEDGAVVVPVKEE